jgi:hypothetical protein
MKNQLLFSTASLVIIAFTQCSKDTQNSSEISKSNVETPAIILGKWELSKEDDTTFQPAGFTSVSWQLKNWFYNFCDHSVLQIGNNEFIDSFTYKFVDENCIKIGWRGTPIDLRVDTIVRLSKKDLVIKHWVKNEDNSKTKQVFYLSK